MNRKLQWLYSMIILLAIPAIFAVSDGIPFEKKALIEEKYAGWSGVLRVWLDQDEGEMAGWLNQCAAQFEKQHNGVYIQVTEVDSFSALEEDGVRPPELVVFAPGAFLAYARLAELPRMNVRVPLRMTNLAVPLAAGSYAWAVNADRISQIPEDGSSIEVTLPMDTARRSYSAALLALSSGVETTADSPVLPMLDLGLTLKAEATLAPTAETVPCRLSESLTATTDAFLRFQNGEADATVVCMEEIERLERLRAQGRGPNWTIDAGAGAVFTDCILLGAALQSGDERESLAVEFLEFLLRDECQRTLGSYHRFSVTDAPTDLPAGSALAALDTALRSDRLRVPPAFFSEWRAEAPSALRSVIARKTSADAALEAILG